MYVLRISPLLKKYVFGVGGYIYPKVYPIQHLLLLFMNIKNLPSQSRDRQIFYVIFITFMSCCLVASIRHIVAIHSRNPLCRNGFGVFPCSGNGVLPQILPHPECYTLRFALLDCSFSAASCWAFLVLWVYLSVVISVCLCPRDAETVLALIPASLQSVA